MAPHRFTCPACHFTLQLGDEEAGQLLFCPGCGSRVARPASHPARDEEVPNASDEAIQRRLAALEDRLRGAEAELRLSRVDAGRVRREPPSQDSGGRALPRESALIAAADVRLEEPTESSEATPLVVAGWLCLAAALGIQALCPAAHALYGIPLAGAFFLGGAAWFRRRRSPLVTGLLALAMVGPTAMMAASHASGFQGLIPHLAPSAPRPQHTPTPSPTQESAPAAQAPAPASPLPGQQPAPIPIGGSATVDVVRVTFDGVRQGHITIRDALSRASSPTQEFLLVDVRLENLRPDTSLFLKQPWEDARCLDDTDRVTEIVPQQRTRLDHVVGTLGSAELEPGIPLRDRLVFELPAPDASQFRITTDPGFYMAAEDGSHQQVSASPLALTFPRSAITRVNPAAARRESVDPEHGIGYAPSP